MTPRAATRPILGGVRQAFAPWEDPAARPLVRFEGVVKRFGAETAVAGVDLAIYEGEFFALLGPSGCGKTTLMRMLAGFESPDAGRVWLGDQDITHVPPHRRPVNMMFQSYALFPHLSVEQNIAFGLKPQKLSKSETAERVAEMLSLVKLDGLARRKPDQLSGGQRQRVALARALAPRPRVLLLDEPLAALDKKLRDETQFELIALQQRLNLTFLIVTHDQEEAMVVADRMAVMRAGQIVQLGRPEELYETPSNRYVAEFVGDVNLFPCRAQSHGAFLAEDGAAFAVEGAPQLAPGETAWLAVRPEKLVLHMTAPPPGANQLAGVIADYGYLGDWTTYLVALPDGRTVRAARANASRASLAPVSCDDPVWLTFAPDAAVVLTS